MYRITIEVDDREDAEYACRLVADKIAEGENFGILGWSTNEWSIEEV